MSLRISGEALVARAVTGNYRGTPYSKLDCQGFVEEVLKDCGVRKANGTPYNWKGSNSMWRNFIQWKGTIAECRKKFSYIPEGAFMFLVEHDGGEVEKGYHDGLGNASHVGLYTGTTPLPCMDSQGNRGVDFCELNVFTHVGLMTMIDYETTSQPEPKPDALKAVNTIRNPDSSDEDCLEALKTLTKYLKGDNI